MKRQPTREIITITAVNYDLKSVDYDGSEIYGGAELSSFPSTPVVGKKYVLVCDFVTNPIVEEFVDNE